MNTFLIFVAVSGWVIAIGMTIWRIVDAVRNRPNVKVSVFVTERVITIEAYNEGIQPVNLINAGLRFANGMGQGYSMPHNMFPIWLYSKRSIAVDFDLKDARRDLKTYNTTIQFVYFTDEKGKVYKGEFSKECEQTLYETDS